MRRHHRFLLSSFLVGLLSAGVSSSAFAGFQWVAPPKTIAQEPMNDMMNAPSAMVAIPQQDIGSELLPEPMMDGQIFAAPVAMQAPPIEETQMASMTDMPQMPMSTASPYATIAGFGRDIPMAMALGQIVPPEYSYSFGEGVIQGAKITWNGGKPWDEVLRAALAPLGYEAMIRNRYITIQKHTAESMAVPQEQMAMLQPTVSQPIQLAKSSDSIAPASVSPQAGADEMVSPQQSAETASGFWHADQGESLRTVVDTWSKDQNIQVIWQTEGDYVLPKTIHSDGSYQEALAAALESFGNSLPRPVGELHVGQDGTPPTLVVSTYSN